MEANEVIGLQSLEFARQKPAPTGFEGNSLDDAVQDLITTYHSLNPSTITTLHSEPSPLEFMRHVSINRPFVICRGASSWPACKKWNTAYLKEIMGSSHVNVAMTPHGNADSILPLTRPGDPVKQKDKEEAMLFIKPHETTEPFTSVIDFISTQELHGRSNGNEIEAHPDQPSTPEPVRYAQTQNDNLRNEYSSLFRDVPRDIPFARIALEKSPDAINFWLGNSHSTTALHKDNYENIYVQVLGKKHFVLLPPVEATCVNERAVLSATYVPKDDEHREVLVPQVDSPEVYTPFCTWDPDRPDENPTRFSHLSQPLRVTLEEGDMLYLPALWYHKVSQSCNEEGVCCAVNYWYDLEFSGGFWSMANFIRGAGLLSGPSDSDAKQKRGHEKEKDDDLK